VIERTFLLHANLADPSSAGSDAAAPAFNHISDRKSAEDYVRLEFLKLTMAISAKITAWKNVFLFCKNLQVSLVFWFC
jgi:hypothetical protein